MRGLLAGVGFLALVAGGLWGLSELGYRLSQRYAPLQEQVRRQTFEQSRAFQEGTVRDLENLHVAYAEGNDAAKAAIRAAALHRLADIPDALLTPELRAWSDSLRSAQP